MDAFARLFATFDHPEQLLQPGTNLGRILNNSASARTSRGSFQLTFNPAALAAAIRAPMFEGPRHRLTLPPLGIETSRIFAEWRNFPQQKLKSFLYAVILGAGMLQLALKDVMEERFPTVGDEYISSYAQAIHDDRVLAAVARVNFMDDSNLPDEPISNKWLADMVRARLWLTFIGHPPIIVQQPDYDQGFARIVPWVYVLLAPEYIHAMQRPNVIRP